LRAYWERIAKARANAGWGLFAFVLGVLVYLVGDGIKAQPWSDVLTGVGGLMASAVAISFMWELIFGEARGKAVVREVLHDKDVLDEVKRAVTDGLIPNARKNGLVGIDNPIDFPSLFRDLNEGDQLLWLATYIETDFDEALTEALQAGAAVRMLVIDPESPCLQLRAQELTDRYRQHYQRQAEVHLGRLRDIAKCNPGGNLTIRTYRDLPNASMFIIRSGGRPVRAQTGFYVGVPLVQSPHLRWGEGAMLDLFSRYFDTKWAANSPRGGIESAGSSVAS
jgi:hypothetical protein